VPIIYHIARKTDWNNARSAESYAAHSLASEGYIHCSTRQQVINTANRLFNGRQDLVLLCVNTNTVKAKIRYEYLEGGIELFPHVYGALEIAAIVAAHDFAPQPDGSFALPPAVQAET
jgi:uncharacterized protein (DUF952 family)